MAEPTKVTVPDDTQREFTRMQGSFALDLRALFEEEQSEIADVVKQASDEGWPVDRLQAELDKIVSW